MSFCTLETMAIKSETGKSYTGEEESATSMFVRIPDLKKRKEPDDNGNDKTVDIGKNVTSKKEFSKPIDDVIHVLGSDLPVRVVLPPTKEENSRCKGI